MRYYRTFNNKYARKDNSNETEFENTRLQDYANRGSMKAK